MLSIAGTQTSGTYAYNTPQTRLIIDNAFRRIGRNPADPTQITSEEIKAAQEFANICLQSWPNRGINLWLRRTAMMSLVPYQYKYDLPLYTTSVREVLRRQSNIASVNGTSESGAGDPSDVFNYSVSGTFFNAGVDGYITYEFFDNTSQQITLVGVIPGDNAPLQLQFESSGSTVLSVPEQDYLSGKLYWFEIPTPKYGKEFTIRETGGNTLFIVKLYFNNQVQDIPLARISESDYMRFPNKSSNPSAPSNFYVDLQINPTMYLYPQPSPEYNCLFFSYQTQVQDFGTMQEYAQIPARFLNALTAEVAFYLSMQYAPDKTAQLQADVERQYNTAHNNDRERVPLRVIGDYQQGGIS